MDKPIAHSITIQIVGAHRGEQLPHEQLRAFMARVEQAISEFFPDFLPANPPVTVITNELRDDWIRRTPTSED